jgi:hypothetical protein
MSHRLKFNTTTDELEIVINPSKKSLLKVGLIAGGLCTIFISIYVFIALFKNFDGDNIFAFLFMIIYIAVVLVAGRNILMRALNAEKIQVTATTLSIIMENGIKDKKANYTIAQIKNMHYAGYQQWTAHPIGNANADFTGLAEREKIVSAINTQGNIAFEYEGEKIYFGHNIPSWDVETIFEKINVFLNYNIDIVEENSNSNDVNVIE